MVDKNGHPPLQIFSFLHGMDELSSVNYLTSIGLSEDMKRSEFHEKRIPMEYDHPGALFKPFQRMMKELDSTFKVHGVGLLPKKHGKEMALRIFNAEPSVLESMTAKIDSYFPSPKPPSSHESVSTASGSTARGPRGPRTAPGPPSRTRRSEGARTTPWPWP